LLWLGHLDVCSLILKLSERIGFPVQRSWLWSVKENRKCESW
jgi:hypothetical protein